MPDPAFDPAAAGWSIVPDTGFLGLVGPLWTREGEDGRRHGILTEAKHANRSERVQGGLLMTLADRALGIAAWEAMDGRRCVTIQFQAQFVSGAALGSFVEARSQGVQRTTSLVFMRGELDVAGRIVLTATGIWKRL